jgi:hypothetical protein
MSERLVNTFRAMALSGKPLEVKPLPNLQSSLKYCECAGIQTPHIHRSDHLECAWCQNKVYPHGRTDAAS